MGERGKGEVWLKKLEEVRKEGRLGMDKEENKCTGKNVPEARVLGMSEGVNR